MVIYPQPEDISLSHKQYNINICDHLGSRIPEIHGSLSKWGQFKYFF